METKKKLNRAVHGEGQKTSPNMHKLTIYLVNPPRKGALSGHGSKDFKTTHTFKDVLTVEKALEILGQLSDSATVNKAYYNGKQINLN